MIRLADVQWERHFGSIFRRAVNPLRPAKFPVTLWARVGTSCRSAVRTSETMHRRFRNQCRKEVLRSQKIRANCHCLLPSVSTHAANHHKVRLVRLCFDFYLIEANPENPIGWSRCLRQRCPRRRDEGGHRHGDVRWEFFPQNFLGSVQLACQPILFGILR
jgi:hypothetical protein